jgi:hypothetical protein
MITRTRLSRTQTIILCLAGALCAYFFWGLAAVPIRYFTVARSGRPIAQAIEQFRKINGHYPASLRELAPKYLSTPPDEANWEARKYSGWEYRIVTNRGVESFSLRYYLGRGGVEYEPPNWIANSEGDRSVIMKDK